MKNKPLFFLTVFLLTDSFSQEPRTTKTKKEVSFVNICHRTDIVQEVIMKEVVHYPINS